MDYTEAKTGTGAYLQRYNIEYRNGEWTIDNQALQSEKIYQIAMTDFLITGYDIPFLTSENNGVIEIYYSSKEEVAFDIRKAIIAYLKKNK